MARREKIITLRDRDQDLSFKIREMSATGLEAWKIRALILLAKTGIEVPEGADLQAVGAYLVANGVKTLTGILGKVDYGEVSPLLDDLLACCSRLVENVSERCTPESVDNYIQDANTLSRLRWEALRLNLDFTGPEDAGPWSSSGDASI
ncbi:hypothetical protein LJC59_00325 [Desulfovibrio sp. OttesenSCG-928-A18]|nr:hypothetical protein [Desulfovibrio sp. OttesenSCG-928-A18]